MSSSLHSTVTASLSSRGGGGGAKSGAKEAPAPASVPAPAPPPPPAADAALLLLAPAGLARPRALRQQALGAQLHETERRDLGRSAHAGDLVARPPLQEYREFGVDALGLSKPRCSCSEHAVRGNSSRPEGAVPGGWPVRAQHLRDLDVAIKRDSELLSTRPGAPSSAIWAAQDPVHKRVICADAAVVRFRRRVVLARDRGRRTAQAVANNGPRG